MSELTLEYQLQMIRTLGLRFNVKPTLDELFKYADREAYERRPFIELFMSFGVDEQDYGYMTKDFWVIDPECIYEAGDYEKIFKRLLTMIGDHPISGLSVSMGNDAKRGELSFRVNGKERKWSIKITGDWWDYRVAMRFMKLLNKNSVERTFYIWGFVGMEGVVACLTDEQSETINNLGSEVKFKPLPFMSHSDLTAFALLLSPIAAVALVKLAYDMFAISKSTMFEIGAIVLLAPMALDQLLIFKNMPIILFEQYTDVLPPKYFTNRANELGYGEWMSKASIVSLCVAALGAILLILI